MKFVFNTRTDPKWSSSRVYFQTLRGEMEKLAECAAGGDWDNYEKYDVAVFNSTDFETEKAKARNPDILVGLAKLNFNDDAFEEMRKADFLLADSPIQRDRILELGKPTIALRFVEAWPEGVKHEPYPGEFTTGRPALIGYHGNILHLEQFGGAAGPALEELAKRVPLKLRAIYNVESLGKWETGRPDIEIEDVEWSLDTVHGLLAECDAGIVTNFSHPVDAEKMRRAMDRRRAGGWYGDNFNDNVVKFKTSVNAGRVFVFMQLGVPVVADPDPESVEVLVPGGRGLTAFSKAGWADALGTLLLDAQKRAYMSEKSYQWARKNLHPKIEALRLLDFVYELRGRK